MIFFIMGSPRVFPEAPVAPDAAGGDGGLPMAGASVGVSETRRVRSNPDVPTRWKGQHTPRELL